MVCVPSLRPLNCAAVRVPLTLTVALVKLPDKAVPLPLLPTLLMKYSAALMVLLPLLTSLTLALIAGAAFVGLGVTLRPEVVGATVSLIKVVDAAVLQLPAASSPFT